MDKVGLEVQNTVIMLNSLSPCQVFQKVEEEAFLKKTVRVTS